MPCFDVFVFKDLYISKEACQEIMIIFCNCLLSPRDYKCTIDVCASFAAQLSTTLYTEQTLLTYGDQLILALFSLSCSINYDPEIISKDTLWEVSTAWQDIITILITCEQITDFENIMWKFTKILHNEFMTNDNCSTIERLSSVTIDLVKCVNQIDNSTKLLNKITNTIMVMPNTLRPIKQQMTHICTCASIFSGELSYLENSPVPEDILKQTWNEENIVKYFNWYQFVVSVVSSLFKKEQQNGSSEDDTPDDCDEAILEENTDEIDSLIVDTLQAYTVGKLFNDKYKTVIFYYIVIFSKK